MTGLRDCPECEHLLDRYRKATKAWRTLNTELAEVALSYEMDIYTIILEKCSLARQFCDDARHAFRDHMEVVHQTSLV
jgi:hypothetical protein